LVLALFSNRAFVDRPARGGQLVEALIGHPVVLNPLFAVEDAEKSITRLLYSGLTRPDALRGPRADLATNWTVSPDGTVYTFYLRESAYWHDGQPVTAHDVVFTADLARRVGEDPSLSVSASPLVRPWARVTATVVDDHTVTLELDEPYAPFLDATALGVLPEHILAGVDPADLPKHRFSQLEPIGTGPFRLDAPGGVESDSVRLARFEDHWDAAEVRPYLDTLEFRFLPSADAAIEAVGQHDVQSMGDVPAGSFDELGDDARLYSTTEPGYALVYLNFANVLFTDLAVRQALSLGLDREGIVHDPELVNGQGVVARSPIAPGSWAHDQTVGTPPHDPARAREVLEEAGWVDSDADGVRDHEGKRLSFRLGSLDDPRSMATAERIADDWREIGVEVTVEPHNQQGIVHALSNHEYDTMLFSWQLRGYEPDPYPLWHSSQAEDGQNFGGYSNPDVDRLLVEARQAHPEDRNERKELFGEFQRIFAEDVPALLIYHPVYTYAVVDPNLGGVQMPQLLVDPADRFMTLPDWFVNTERVFRDDAGS
jgi:peptide/nickel transport system substrate-binding protein